MKNSIAKALRVASRQTHKNPSDAQKESGNYAKGKLRWYGETIAIENPKGSKRSGVDANGKRWECTLPSAYGYFLGTEGKDGDHVDCYIGDDHDSKKVFVIDQIDSKTGKFDEHKVLLSFPDKDSAVANYKRAFSDGKGQERIGHVAEMPIERFKDWLHNGNTKAPIAKGYASGGAVHGGAMSMAGQDQSRKVMQAIALALETARRGSQERQSKADGGPAGVKGRDGTQSGYAPRQASMRAYNPTWRDNVAMALRRAIGSDDRMMSPPEERLVSGVTGSSGLGVNRLSPLDVIPGVGHAIAATDAAEQVGRGNVPMAVLDAAAMAVPYGVGKAASRFFRHGDLGAAYPHAMSRLKEESRFGQSPSLADDLADPEFRRLLPGMERRATRDFPSIPNTPVIAAPTSGGPSRVEVDDALRRLSGFRSFNEAAPPPRAQMHADGGRVGRADGGPTERPAELKTWKPSLYEDLVHKAGEVFGDTPDSHRAVRNVLSPDDPLRKGVLEVAEPAAHMGAYLTPAAPVVGAYDIGGLLSDVAGGARKFYDTLTTPSSPFDEIKPATRDEFYASKRTQRGSVQDAQTAAENAVRNSRPYIDAMAENRRTTAQKMLEDARKGALSAWQADQGSIGNEDARIEADWKAELADRKSRSDAELRKPWYERHPALGQAVGLGSLGASALMARRGFNKIADTTNNLVGAAKTARASGDLGAEAEALAAINTQGRRLPWEYAKTVGKAALLPSGIRGVGTAGDAIAAPDIINPDGSVDPTSARQQARALLEHTFTDPMGFASEMGPGLMTGLEGSAIGAILARRPAMAEMAAQRAFIPQSAMTKGKVSTSPDELALPLGDARAAMLRKQRELDELRALPPVRPQSEMPPQALRETTTTRPDILDIDPMSGPMGQPMRAKEIWPQTQQTPALTSSNEARVSFDPPERPVGVTRALDVVKNRSVTPTTTTTTDATPKSRIIRYSPDRKVVLRNEGGRKIARHAKGQPNGGAFASHPTPTKKSESTQGQLTNNDVAVDKNGIPIKPPKAFDPDDPINRGYARGGVTHSALNLARRYARGGVVVGAVTGPTGGREDRLPVEVPAGAFVVSADVVSALGTGNTLKGNEVLDQMLGGKQVTRASGGAVPIKISDGEYVVSPEAVARIGGGDMEKGHRILEQFMLDTRRNHIDTLKSLPGPSR